MQNQRPDNSLQPGPGGHGTPAGQLSPTERIARLFTAPGSAFTGLFEARNKPGVIGLALLAVILITSVATILVADTAPVVEMSELVESRMEQSIEGNRSLSAKEKRDALEAARQFSGPPTPLSTVVQTLLTTPLIALLVGLAVLIVGKVMERGEETRIDFLTAVSVSSLSQVVLAVVVLVLAMLQLATDFDFMYLGAPTFLDIADMQLYISSTVLTVSNLVFLLYLSVGTRKVADTDSPAPFAIYLILSALMTSGFGALSTLGM